MNPLTLLPPRVRQAIYVVYGILSLAGTAALAYFAAVPLDVPHWLAGGLAALGALAGPIGALAASNVQPAADA